MSLLAIAGLAVSAAGSIGQMISGAHRKSQAKKALENYQRQELRNITEGMRVSTLGAELQTKEAQRRFATSVEALQSGGVRALAGGLGSLEQQQATQQQQIAADLDRQQAQIEQMRAQDESNIRGLQEQRETQEIAGLGQELGAGRQLTNAGISGLAQTGLSAFTMGAGAPKALGVGADKLKIAGDSLMSAGNKALNALSQPIIANSYGSGNNPLGALGDLRTQVNPFNTLKYNLPQ